MVEQNKKNNSNKVKNKSTNINVSKKSNTKSKKIKSTNVNNNNSKPKTKKLNNNSVKKNSNLNKKNTKKVENTINKKTSIKHSTPKINPVKKEKRKPIILNDNLEIINNNNVIKKKVSINNQEIINKSKIKNKQKKKKYKLKKKWVIMLLLLVIFISFFGFTYSIVNIMLWKRDNKIEEKQINNIKEVVEVNESEDSENTVIVPQEEEIPKFDPYWDYIKMSLINVDFNELKNINSSTAGWLQVGGTNINYPYVQAKDNKYYLKHTFDKSYNSAGWAFLDYRNNKDEFGKNTIIYGHALKSGAIFGTLKNILKERWQNNIDNHIVKISTENENSLWQVFSIYTVPSTGDYLRVKFTGDEDFLSFADYIKSRSIRDFGTTVSASDKILTLSSCYINSDNKIVLHAKLIKMEKR